MESLVYSCPVLAPGCLGGRWCGSLWALAHPIAAKLQRGCSWLQTLLLLVVALEIPDRIFQRHGGWRDPSNKDRYVRDTLGRRLEVTRAMLHGVAELEGG
jgi:hypothetical protein